MATAPEPAPAAAAPARSRWRRARSRFARDPVGLLGLVLVAAVVAMAVLAPVLAPRDPMATSLVNRMKAPGAVPGYPLGTDELGRDVLSRVIYGARISLVVSASSVVLSVALGTWLGLTAGYFRGWVDQVVSILVDIFMAFPFILLALAVIAVLGPGLLKLIAVLGITGWTDYARVVRAETLALREREFVGAARAAGATHRHILVRHLLPNVAPTVLVLATLALARVILLAASLSYLGLGVPPNTPDWGLMVSRGQLNLARAWWTVAFPGAGILVAVLGINLVGDRLRDILDPKLD